MTQAGSADVFVGREDALAVLAATVEAAAEGKGGLVVVVGEAGIGKTRLVSEAAERASLVTAWSRCWEGEGAPAFGAWTQLLRALGGDAAPSSLVDLAGVGAGDDRLALFDAVADRLAAASVERPLLLVIDDLQWADHESLRLLRYLSRDPRARRVAIVCTCRDEAGPADPAVAETMAEIVAGGVHLPLGGLAVDDVATLAGRLGAGHGADVAVALHRRSGGNPLFIREFVRLPGDAAAAVPPGVRAVISARLAQLSTMARDVLTAGAVLGAEFDLADVGAVAGIEGGAVLGAIDEARAGGLVVERGRSRAFGFVHAVVHEVLYDGLRLADRARLEIRAADALERRLGPRAAPEIAQHLLRGAVDEGDERAVEWAVRAAEQSFSALAYERAVGWYGHALALLPPAAGGHREAELLIRRGEASLAAGDVPGARDTFRQAAAVAREVGDAERLSRAALGLGSGTAGFDVPMWDRSHVALLEEALAAVSPSAAALRAQIQARLAVALWTTGDDERRRSLSDEAVAVARRAGDVAVLAAALAAHCDVNAGPEFVEARHAEATEVIELARRTGDRALELVGLRHRLLASLERGDVAAADEDRVRFAHVVDDLGQLIYRWYSPLWQGMRALMLGDIAEASRCTAIVQDLGADAESDNAYVLAFTQWWMTERYEGRFAEAAEATRTAAGFAPGATPLVTGWSRVRLEAVIAAQLGQLDQARAHLDVLLSMGIDDQPRSAEWLPEMAQVAEVAAITGHVPAARVLLALLAPHAGRCCIEGAGAAFAGSVRWYLAMLARTVGDTSAADRYGAEAGEAHRRVGLVGDPPPLAPWPAAATATRTAAPAQGAALVHEGTTWAVTFAGETRRVRDGKGMGDLAVLISRPSQEVHCLELVGGVDVGGDRGPAVDERARRQYQQRIRDLQEDIDEARAANDPMRAERAEDELDALVEQLSQAFGLSGRARASGGAAERARSTVTTRIRSAMRHVASIHPSLGHHLQHSVRTGTWCSYAPEHPVSWEVRR